jgi:gamma-glutamyltranspeptidase/glutathione hydrolase
MAASIAPDRAAPWGQGLGPADTVWMGVIDSEGTAVSFIQSIYHEFGSGLVLPSSGINWQNRGCSFSLDPKSRNPLTPFRKPFHTLNPALARFDDGRTLVMNPQEAISAPRWLLGRTWGQTSDSLKLEARFSDATVAALRAMGHEVDVLAPMDETMGHAGAIIRHPNGLLEGASDPRSDGAAAGW